MSTWVAPIGPLFKFIGDGWAGIKLISHSDLALQDSSTQYQLASTCSFRSMLLNTEETFFDSSMRSTEKWKVQTVHFFRAWSKTESDSTGLPGGEHLQSQACSGPLIRHLGWLGERGGPGRWMTGKGAAYPERVWSVHSLHGRGTLLDIMEITL